MIVVDTNLIVYLHLKGEHTSLVRKVLDIDPDWRSPRLWRTEYINVLWLHVRHSRITQVEALDLMRVAMEQLEGCEVPVDDVQALLTAIESGITAYDARFVVAARTLGTKLVTGDRALVKACPDVAVHLFDFH